MRKVIPLAVSLALLVSLSSCKAKEMFDSAKASADLNHRGTSDVLKEAAKDQYTPPADGRLTDAQVQMYLKVREHEKQIADVARKQLQAQAKKAEAEGGDKSLSGMVNGFKALGTAAELATADIRAAQDLHYNTAEYTWVKSRIFEASTATLAAKVSDSSKALADNAYLQMKKQYDEAKDEQTKKTLGALLAGYDQQRQGMDKPPQPDAATVYNQQLLSKYDTALNVYSSEITKWTGNDDQTKKAIDDFQKNLEEAAKKSQTH